jgi:hypothetical protein
MTLVCGGEALRCEAFSLLCLSEGSELIVTSYVAEVSLTLLESFMIETWRATARHVVSLRSRRPVTGRAPPADAQNAALP